MRITFVVTVLDSGGGARVVLDYAAYLRGRGHEVTVVEHSLPKPPLRQRLRHIIRNARRRRRFPDVLRVDVTKAGWERRFPEADAVIATWWLSCECVALLPAAKGKKIHFVQGHEVFVEAHAERIRASMPLIPPKIVVAGWLADVMRDEYRLTDVRVVQNGVDLDRFSAGWRTRNLVPVVGTVYSRTECKNSGMALEAVRLARLSVPELRLMVFGIGPRPAELGDADREDYHQNPSRGAIAQLYGSCSAWLFSSISEGFGLPVLEAMASGAPVIATRAGAAPDLIDGRNGTLVETTAEAMAAEIVRLCLLPPAEWKAMSQAARATAERHCVVAARERFETAIKAICAAD